MSGGGGLEELPTLHAFSKHSNWVQSPLEILPDNLEMPGLFSGKERSQDMLKPG